MKRSVSSGCGVVWLVHLVLGLSSSCGTVRAQSARPPEHPFSAQLALRWAPVHYQDVAVGGKHGLGGRADFLTAINFDGDWDTSNNWENIANQKYPAKAVCYYSVVATRTHWFILYAFYHPRDWSDFLGLVPVGLDEHENDLEGLLAIIRRPRGRQTGDARFGRLLGIVTVFHHDFFSFTPADSPLTNGRETIDGTLKMETYNGQPHPVTAQQAHGHGLKAWPFVKIEGKHHDGIKYFPTLDTAEQPTGPNDRNVKYKLVDIFAPGGLWAHRNDPQTFSEPGVFHGNNGSGHGHGPWKWDDKDDGGELRGGELARDPAKLTAIYFGNLGAFARQYEHNPYGK